MAIAPLRVEDRLDGASKILSWKKRVTLALKEYDLCELVDKIFTPLTDPKALDAQNKKELKVERVLLHFVNDHLIPHLNKKNMAKEMFDALVNLFQRKNMNRKMVLRNKLISVQISRSDNVTNYLMRIIELCDKLVAIGEKKEDAELMNVALNVLPNSWEPFFKGVCI
jgi:hypothetical protein